MFIRDFASNFYGIISQFLACEEHIDVRIYGMLTCCTCNKLKLLPHSRAMNAEKTEICVSSKQTLRKVMTKKNPVTWFVCLFLVFISLGSSCVDVITKQSEEGKTKFLEICESGDSKIRILSNNCNSRCTTAASKYCLCDKEGE